MSKTHTKRLAWFQTGGIDYECGEWAEDHQDYVRLSEFVTIEFPLLDQNTVVENRLSSLQRVEQALREKFQVSLDGIKEERSKLLALNAPQKGADE